MPPRPHLSRKATPKPIPRAQKKRLLVQKKRRFAEVFLQCKQRGLGDNTAKERAVAAAGYKTTHALMQADKLLQDPLVKATVEQAVRKHMERAEVNGEAIMRYWLEIAMCEIPWPLAGPCRHCWGIDHQYQYTQAEYRTAMRKHTAEQLKKQPHNRVPFDDLGGMGFDRTKKPHPYCPECHGEGRNYARTLDPDKLTEAQRHAIDEIKVGKDGSVSLKMRDRSRAMENLQQLMGLIQPRKPLEVIDPARPIEENVNILIQTAVDQGLINVAQPLPLPPVIDNDGTAEQLADAATG
jgi:phage terminase small subunit